MENEQEATTYRYNSMNPFSAKVEKMEGEVCKRNIRLLFIQDGTVKNLENLIKENFYCAFYRIF